MTGTMKQHIIQKKKRGIKIIKNPIPAGPKKIIGITAKGKINTKMTNINKIGSIASKEISPEAGLAYFEFDA